MIAPLRHISHVLGKLGVADRTEAVDGPGQPGLIPQSGIRCALSALSCRGPAPETPPAMSTSG